jgi:hypothetical protein
VHKTLTTPKPNREKSKNQSKTIGDKAKTVEMKSTFLDNSKTKKADPLQKKSCQLTSKKRYQLQRNYCHTQSTSKFIIKS